MPGTANTAAALQRNPAHSPYGMRWQNGRIIAGPVGLLVRAVFGVIEAVIFLVLLPVRAVSRFAGRGILWLLRLPFRLLQAAAQLVGLLVVAGLVLLVVVALLSLVGAM